MDLNRWEGWARGSRIYNKCSGGDEDFRKICLRKSKVCWGEGDRGRKGKCQGAGGGLAGSDHSASWGHRLGLQKTLEDTGQALGQQRDCVCGCVCDAE